MQVNADVFHVERSAQSPASFLRLPELEQVSVFGWKGRLRDKLQGCWCDDIDGSKE